MVLGKLKLGVKEPRSETLPSAMLRGFFYGGGVVAQTARLKILGLFRANQKVNCFCVKQGQSVAVPTARQHLILYWR
jgi:hypothetical protein